MKHLVPCLTLGVVLAMTAGCGNSSSTTIKGEVGLTRGADNHLMALVTTCGSPITLVDVAGSREGLEDGQANPELGEYVASKPTSGTIRLDLEAGSQGWKTTKHFAAAAVPTTSIVVTGFNRESDSETQSTTATREQLKALEPGRVLRSDGSTVPENRFITGACAG